MFAGDHMTKWFTMNLECFISIFIVTLEKLRKQINKYYNEFSEAGLCLCNFAFQVNLLFFMFRHFSCLYISKLTNTWDILYLQPAQRNMKLVQCNPHPTINEINNECDLKTSTKSYFLKYTTIQCLRLVRFKKKNLSLMLTKTAVI